MTLNHQTLQDSALYTYIIKDPLHLISTTLRLIDQRQKVWIKSGGGIDIGSDKIHVSLVTKR